MPSLLDQIDHLTSTAKAIRSSASSISPGQGPFTTAVLSTPLGNLIRDIDASELGLFTLVPPPGHPISDANTKSNPKANTKGKLARVEFPGATPLKRPPRRVAENVPTPARLRKGTHERETGKDKVVADYDPEVYAQAALKYLDRYQSIRPMPRARAEVTSLLEQLAETRERIQTLTDTLQKIANAGLPPAHPPLSQSAAEEEKRALELQDRLTELRKRKAALMRPTQVSRISPVSHSPPKLSLQTQKLGNSLARSQSQDHDQESTFWTTPGPGPSARTLRFTENLLHEPEPETHLDFGDVSNVSFSSPVQGDILSSIIFVKDQDKSIERMEDQENSTSNDQVDQESMMQESDAEEIMDDEQTVVLPKVPLSTTTLEDVPRYVSQNKPMEDSTAPGPSSKDPPPESAKKKAKMRINSETERIVAKIWSTVAEIIMPGHPFDIGPNATVNKPPRAKETLAYLQTLTTLTPTSNLDSPSTSSLSSHSLSSQTDGTQTTVQQILIAHLLLALLSAPPGYSMSLGRLKEVVAERSSTGSGAGAGATRALYGCVAKKLIKIQRGSGEQVVKFDV
ncbi:hypothetical protein SERLA73DRAFT_159804 [Serpula lacrymans var. lacrymans S7.3]|uniref:Uncharacterized protein n=2 Tax=Serpula lacrymans var. lacrymans TaxID=341189 RepID=F8PVU5_SERL3|nr:uncharacterized protein SERLADRAFT_414831 [Serpula lacrymans var. lacrymans S7.9]EGN99541.1 hypothetical protein SERLA73DRAFT_159804 [Serpula lacrymans var. lacrymans S7.3]EGO25110.1 hypothetical protein SERLADRAFT_414831 [Serpula lacrymans var. lacrymans S7.9]